MTIVTRAGLLLAATVFAAACAPADAPSTTGPSGAPASAAGAACPKGGLSTLVPDTLTVGTDQPVYQPWYVDDAPENGQGFESAVAYAIADQLGYPKDKVAWTRVPFNAAISARPEVLRPQPHRVLDHRRAQAGRRLLGALLRRQAGRRRALGQSRSRAPRTSPGSRSARLGAQVGTTSYDAIDDMIKPNTPAAVFNTNDDAKLALSNGQVDAIVVDLPTAFFITSAELQNAKIVGQLPAGTGTPEQFGAVLDKGSPLTSCVSEAVETLRSAGTLAALEQQWLTSAGSAPELT